jgi:FlaA1/EpsC-like NDP-sugar epimerase
VTVTDERMTRYFMTIPEAVQLIIRSGSLVSDGSHGPDVFVLDMGEPVRIVDLARAMIELSGLDPDRDVAIDIVGRRPGEKLHEELFNGYERARSTPAEKILLAEREPLAPETVEAMFNEIGLLVLEGDAAGLAAKVSAFLSVRAELSESVMGPRHDRAPADRVPADPAPADRAPADPAPADRSAPPAALIDSADR